MVPVFVPSYKRPNATFLRRSMICFTRPLYVFVRKEELNDYKWVKKRPNTHLICLKNVHDIGETRAAMVRYAIKHKIPKIFMLDDDITSLAFVTYDKEKGFCTTSNRNVKWKEQNWEPVFDCWERNWTDEVLFGLRYRRYIFSFSPEELNKKERASLAACVGVNIKLLAKYKINYRSNVYIGSEDLYLQFECVKAGLKTCVINSLCYDCPAMFEGTGGCTEKEFDSWRNNHAQLAWEASEHSPYLIIRKNTSGHTTIKLNWKVIPK